MEAPETERASPPSSRRPDADNISRLSTTSSRERSRSRSVSRDHHRDKSRSVSVPKPYKDRYRPPESRPSSSSSHKNAETPRERRSVSAIKEPAPAPQIRSCSVNIGGSSVSNSAAVTESGCLKRSAQTPPSPCRRSSENRTRRPPQRRAPVSAASRAPGRHQLPSSGAAHRRGRTPTRRITVPLSKTCVVSRTSSIRIMRSTSVTPPPSPKLIPQGCADPWRLSAKRWTSACNSPPSSSGHPVRRWRSMPEISMLRSSCCTAHRPPSWTRPQSLCAIPATA
ncbi:hypothetical protein MuHV1_gp036 [Murid betaherpesvirus 1]|uniref:hypothetical protein n=1 Tax=Murid herpesvirus 1 TaxID=10366 RepID=UPI00004EBBDF|nr:hypothetical protein MuHV1_gp036 [Murid betaherpesvirus 1]